MKMPFLLLAKILIITLVFAPSARADDKFPFNYEFPTVCSGGKENVGTIRIDQTPRSLRSLRRLFWQEASASGCEIPESFEDFLRDMDRMFGGDMEKLTETLRNSPPMEDPSPPKLAVPTKCSTDTYRDFELDDRWTRLPDGLAMMISALKKLAETTGCPVEPRAIDLLKSYYAMAQREDMKLSGIALRNFKDNWKSYLDYRNSFPKGRVAKAKYKVFGDCDGKSGHSFVLELVQPFESRNDPGVTLVKTVQESGMENCTISRRSQDFFQSLSLNADRTMRNIDVDPESPFRNFDLAYCGALSADDCDRGFAAPSATKSKPESMDSNKPLNEAWAPPPEDRFSTAEIQEFLLALRYPIGSPDGVAGPKTREALAGVKREYEAAFGRQISGRDAAIEIYMRCIEREGPKKESEDFCSRLVSARPGTAKVSDFSEIESFQAIFDFVDCGSGRLTEAVLEKRLAASFRFERLIYMDLSFLNGALKRTPAYLTETYPSACSDMKFADRLMEAVVTSSVHARIFADYYAVILKKG